MLPSLMKRDAFRKGRLDGKRANDRRIIERAFYLVNQGMSLFLGRLRGQ